MGANRLNGFCSAGLGENMFVGAEVPFTFSGCEAVGTAGVAPKRDPNGLACDDSWTAFTFSGSAGFPVTGANEKEVEALGLVVFAFSASEVAGVTEDAPKREPNGWAGVDVAGVWDAKAGLAAKPSALSLDGFSAFAEAVKLPNGLAGGGVDVAVGLGENKLEVAESPKMFRFWKEDEELRVDPLGFASGDICIESAAAFALVLLVADCPNKLGPVDVLAVC